MRLLKLGLIALVFVGCGKGSDKSGAENDPPKKSIESELIGEWNTQLHTSSGVGLTVGSQEILPDGKAIYSVSTIGKDKTTYPGTWKWISDRKFKLTRKDPVTYGNNEYEVELQYNDTFLIKPVGGTDTPLTYSRVKKPGEIRK